MSKQTIFLPFLIHISEKNENSDTIDFPFYYLLWTILTTSRAVTSHTSPGYRCYYPHVTSEERRKGGRTLASINARERKKEERKGGRKKRKKRSGDVDIKCQG